jgi:zinc transport system substrate-binding protein
LRVIAIATVLAIAMALSAASAQAVSIVVTVHPLALLLHEIGGEEVDVHVLVPPGASPHSFEPKPSDLVRLARADGFLSIGGGLDDWAGRLSTTAGRTDNIATLLGLVGKKDDAHHGHGAQSEAHGDDDDDDEHGDDPHIWLDPMLVEREIVPALSGFLARVDPANAALYSARADQFRKRLVKLDKEVEALLASDARHYVAFHNAWRHFAARYDLHEIAVVQEMAGEEPTPRELGNLVREARRAKLESILIEPQLDPRLAVTISAEFGGTTVLVDPLGDPHDPERSTYPGLMRFNARAFRAAMVQRNGESH